MIHLFGAGAACEELAGADEVEERVDDDDGTGLEEGDDSDELVVCVTTGGDAVEVQSTVVMVVTVTVERLSARTATVLKTSKAMRDARRDDNTSAL
jgi:hypothetical protein